VKGADEYSVDITISIIAPNTVTGITEDIKAVEH
jgi:hypothetical protein